MKNNYFGLEELTPNKMGNLANILLIKRNFLRYGKDFDIFFENSEEFNIICGRCPSKKFNLIHLQIYKAISEIQKETACKVTIPLSTEEVYLQKNEDLDEVEKRAISNASNILALDWNLKNTEFIVNTTNIKSQLFRLSLIVSKHINENTFKKILGQEYFKNVGLFFVPSIEVAEILLPAYYSDCHTLLIAPLSQEPFLRIARYIAEKEKINKPIGLFSDEAVDLRGGTRRQANEEGALYLEDNLSTIENKINKGFTGGKESKEIQKKEGGKTDICSIYWYLKIFEELDKNFLNLHERCQEGKILCYECKQRLFEEVKRFINGHTRNKKEKEGIIKKQLNTIFKK